MRRKRITYHFRNLSIFHKMVVSLIVCIIIPCIVLGMLVSIRVVHLSEQNQYETQINHLITSEKDFENICVSSEQAAATLANENSVQAILKGNASVLDYRYAARSMKEKSESIKGCSCIAVMDDRNVKFQRGTRYLYEEEKLSTAEEGEKGSLSIWLPEQRITFQHGINITKRKQIIYSTAVMDGMEVIGNINIYLDVEDIIGNMMPYLDVEQGKSMNIHTAVLMTNGNILMQSSKNDLVSEYLKKIKNDKSEEIYGYFPVKANHEECIVLYAKCDSSGWYLFQTEKRITFYNMQISVIVAVIFLCILFGGVYGSIQNRTIIQPLQHLSKRMDAVKNGVMEKKNYKVAQDEIGNVESGFEDMVAELRKLINEVYIQTIKTKDAEREMLLAKMNPHFLYNALDSIHWLAFRNKDYEVSEQLEALANVYRHILQFEVGKIRIEKEQEFIENYLFLLECQMGDRIEFDVNIPEYLYQYKIPKLMIQPLIENAVIHGLGNKNTGGKVKICMRKKEKNIYITVADNGCGCDIEKLWKKIHERESKEAFALRNIEERLKLNSDGEDSMRLYSKKGVCFIVVLTVKVEESEDEINGSR